MQLLHLKNLELLIICEFKEITNETKLLNCFIIILEDKYILRFSNCLKHKKVIIETIVWREKLWIKYQNQKRNIVRNDQK